MTETRATFNSHSGTTNSLSEPNPEVGINHGSLDRSGLCVSSSKAKEKALTRAHYSVAHLMSLHTSPVSLPTQLCTQRSPSAISHIIDIQITALQPTLNCVFICLGAIRCHSGAQGTQRDPTVIILQYIHKKCFSFSPKKFILTFFKMQAQGYHLR